jgi:hypothetical protein
VETKTINQVIEKRERSIYKEDDVLYFNKKK